MSTIRTLVERLQENLAKQQKAVAELAVYASLKDQGFSADTIQALGFEERFLDKRELLDYRKAIAFGRDPYVDSEGKLHTFNAVRLKDGSVHKLNPMIRRP